MKIILSDSLFSKKSYRNIDRFKLYHDQEIINPQKFFAKREFHEWHKEYIFMDSI
jgi:hypothetical protein